MNDLAVWRCGGAGARAACAVLPAVVLVLGTVSGIGRATESLERPPGMAADAFAAQVERWGGLDRRIRANVGRFIRSYPQAIHGVQARPGNPVTLRTQDRQIVVFEDFRTKSFEERLETSDVNEMLADPYPGHLVFKVWPENLDPGRYRSAAFLKAVYGASPEAVQASLVRVPFCGKTVLFNGRNGAADALAAVGRDLEGLVARDASIRPYLDTLGGSFAWRPIAGSQQLSAHCFAIAIDLNPSLGGYWRWQKGDMGAMKRRVEYPAAVVAVFERHGFVWGGKWFHFDLMHFEFRPEFQGRNPFAPQTARH